MKAAVIFHRLGPYHFARLRAVGKLLAVAAIETSGADETYAWDLIAGADGFERVTLFQKADAQKQPPREVVRRMEAALDKIQPQVVVTPGWSDKSALAAVRWCVQNQIPAIVMSESTAGDETRRVWREAVKRRIVGLCSAALVGGRPHKDYLVQLGMPAERVFLGYDVVDNGYFGEKAEMLKAETLKAESRKQYGLPENFFLASARFIEKKNLPRLIEAYGLYRKKAETLKTETLKSEIWNLVLLGDGPLRGQLEATSRELGVSRWVHLPGFKQYPDLPAYYGLANAFIHASTTEQWGLVVNEAMASGLPVLVSNRCGCATDLVQEGVNGFTFDPYNVEQLAELMLRAWSVERGAWSKMGDASRQIIADWGPERFASGLKAAVDKALEVGSKRATFLDRMLLAALLRR